MKVPDLHYFDFDLAIEPSEHGYRARVLNTPEGLVESDFQLPFPPMKLENLLLKAGQRRGQVRRVDSPQLQAAKDLGGPLFDAVFAGDVGTCFEQRRNEAAQHSAGLRIRLHFAKAPELSDVPWEYLYNPKLNRFLALSTETPVVRYLDLPDTVRSLTVKPPLRVLVMIANPNDSPAPLDVEREWRHLQQALDELRKRKLVEVERLDRATLADLQQALRRNKYHIFHFIGHGHFDNRAQDGVLLLEDEQKSTWAVTGQDLGMHLHNHRWLRLAILNACEGARPSLVDPFAGTAQSLVQQGIPAVIAMQFEISDEAAIAFTHEFYKALADSYPVDAALTEARLAIWRQATDAEWATPVLYLRAPDGRIFDVSIMDKSPANQDGEAALSAAGLAREGEADGAKRVEQSGLLGSHGLSTVATAVVLGLALFVGLTQLPKPSSSEIRTPSPAATAATLLVTVTASTDPRTTPTVIPTAVPTASATQVPEPALPAFAALDATPVTSSGRHDVRFDAPWALAVDGQGNVYVADGSSQRVQKLSPTGQPLAQWGKYGQGPGEFDLPEGVAVDGQGNVYVTEAINDRVQKLSSTGQPLAQWGSQGSGPGEFAGPQGVAVDDQGNLYVADSGMSRIQKLSSTGQPLAQWGSPGTELGQFSQPAGVAVDGQGNVYVADLLNDRVQKLSATGQPLAQWGGHGEGPGQFDMPYGVAVDGQGNIYVAEGGNARIQKLSASGQPLAQWGSQVTKRNNQGPRPAAVALDGQGNIYLANVVLSRVLKLSPTGQVLAIWGG